MAAQEKETDRRHSLNRLVSWWINTLPFTDFSAGLKINVCHVNPSNGNWPCPPTRHAKKSIHQSTAPLGIHTHEGHRTTVCSDAQARQAMQREGSRMEGMTRICLLHLVRQSDTPKTLGLPSAFSTPSLFPANIAVWLGLWGGEATHGEAEGGRVCILLT